MYLQLWNWVCMYTFIARTQTFYTLELKKKKHLCNDIYPWALLQSNREKFSNLYNSVQYMFMQRDRYPWGKTMKLN